MLHIGKYLYKFIVIICAKLLKWFAHENWGGTMRAYNLCRSGCCPVVEVGTKNVKIGEEDNLCTLKKSEWKRLVRKIKKQGGTVKLKANLL